MPQLAKRVVFTGTYQAELQEYQLDHNTCTEHEILVRSLYSIISAGTEGAAFSGLEAEHPFQKAFPGAPDFSYPVYPGYGNVGKIVEVGAEVSDFKPGDVVFTTATHSSLAYYDSRRVCVHVPAGLDLKRAVFGRMAGVAITALRKSEFLAGDKVLVIGLGLVGNFAAQLFKLAGGDVMAVDVSPARLEQARQCGLTRVFNPKETDLTAAVNEWTGNKGARVVVEAIGQPQLIEQGAELAARNGDLVLLGSPRQRVNMDVTPLLTCVHIKGLTMRGALEWRFPIPESDFAHTSIVGNMRNILDWIASGAIVTDPLLTQVLSPAQCQEAYAGLDKKKDEYLGVLFDWSK